MGKYAKLAGDVPAKTAAEYSAAAHAVHKAREVVAVLRNADARMVDDALFDVELALFQCADRADKAAHENARKAITDVKEAIRAVHEGRVEERGRLVREGTRTYFERDE